jgi:hypothetical protein
MNAQGVRRRWAWINQPRTSVPAGSAVARESDVHYEPRRLSRCVLNWLVPTGMVGALAAYVCLHSPARALVAALFHAQTRGCYFCPANWSEAAGPLSALTLATAGVLAGWAIATRFEGTTDERVLVMAAAALGLISIPAALVGLTGLEVHVPFLRPPMGPLLASVPAALVLARALSGGWRPRFPRLTLRKPSRLVMLVYGLAISLQLGAIGISLAHPATSGDALSYHAPLAVFLWRDGDLGAFLERAPQTWALAHPGVAELWYGLLWLIGGEALADMGQAPFAVMGAVAVFTFARRLGLMQGARLLAAGAFLLVPMLVLQIASQPNDVAGAALLMASIALASAPIQRWNAQRLAIVGTCLGLLATTKLALLPAAAAIGLFIAGGVVYAGRQRRDVRRTLLQLSLLAFIFMAAVGPWWTRNIALYGNPLFPSAIPVLGRGVVVADFGPVDISFVPGPAAWPLYPLLEAQDDRSGFGPLVAVAMLPGLACVVARRARAPLALYALTVSFMLPAWWIATLHEPRFLLGLIGLGFAFIPWSLVAIPRPSRYLGAGVLAAAALMSALVTIDQGLLPQAQQPVARAQFYDRVWAVDPAASELPETQGLLLNTGFAPLAVPEYAAYYPLLGDDQSRRVIPVEGSRPVDDVVHLMREANVQYAYVLAAPQNRAQVEAIYSPVEFDLVHRSVIVPGQLNGARRTVYRLATPAEEPLGTTRYLFRLR